MKHITLIIIIHLSIIYFLINENKKKPKLTKANLNASAAKGVESCTITFPEIKADDQSKTNIRGKN